MAVVCEACPPKLETLFADLLALERCTDADYDRATDAIASGAKTEAELMSEWAPMGLEIGTVVKIKNLKSRPELNGCEATVIDFRIANRRYGLQLSGGEGEKIAVKPDNIQEVGGMDAVSVLAGRLGADVAGIVGGFMACTRCLEPCVPGSKCRVPHPTHLRTELGMMSGPDGMRSSFGCNACEQQYVRVTPWERTPDGKLAPAEPRFEGSQWCFAGVHTTAPVPASDRRRVYAHTEALVASATLQQEIDALPADVQTLTITSGSGFYDESLNAFTLERHLPELRELQLVDVSFAKIVLNSALTPSVQSLRMQNVPDECDLTIELPNLKSVSIHFLGDCDEVINTMLEHATSLERFDSYKLWVGELHFASNELIEVDLHRSDSLETLTLYAPNLRRLGLQACYGLNRLTFRTFHPTLSSGLPHNCTPPPLEVNTTNANLGRHARRALLEHPSVVQSRRRHEGMPTEAMFAGMGSRDEEEEDDEDDDDEDEGDDDEYGDDDEDGDDDDGGDDVEDGFGAGEGPAALMQMLAAMQARGELPAGGAGLEQMMQAMMMQGMLGDEDEDDEDGEYDEDDEDDEDDDDDDDDGCRIEEIENGKNPPPLEESCIEEIGEPH